MNANNLSNHTAFTQKFSFKNAEVAFILIYKENEWFQMKSYTVLYKLYDLYIFLLNTIFMLLKSLLDTRHTTHFTIKLILHHNAENYNLKGHLS
jgi:hypothetical protein